MWSGNVKEADWDWAWKGGPGPLATGRLSASARYSMTELRQQHGRARLCGGDGVLAGVMLNGGGRLLFDRVALLAILPEPRTRPRCRTERRSTQINHQTKVTASPLLAPPRPSSSTHSTSPQTDLLTSWTVLCCRSWTRSPRSLRPPVWLGRVLLVHRGQQEGRRPLGYVHRRYATLWW